MKEWIDLFEREHVMGAIIAVLIYIIGGTIIAISYGGTLDFLSETHLVAWTIAIVLFIVATFVAVLGTSLVERRKAGEAIASAKTTFEAEYKKVLQDHVDETEVRMIALESECSEEIRKIAELYSGNISLMHRAIQELQDKVKP